MSSIFAGSSGDGNYRVDIKGLEGLTDFELAPLNFRRAASLAINKTISRAKAEASRQIRQQVNFPAHYLSGQNGKLNITKKAQGEDLEAIITGTSRPTSLARFSLTSSAKRSPGVRVQVQPGLATRNLKRAFFIRLRAATDPQDARSVVGLAVRLPEGKQPSKAYKAKELAKGLWLLYGPSVDQVFKSVASDIAPEMAEFLEVEFLRLSKLDFYI